MKSVRRLARLAVAIEISSNVFDREESWAAMRPLVTIRAQDRGCFGGTTPPAADVDDAAL